MKHWLSTITRLPVPTRIEGAVDLRMSEWTTPIPSALFDQFKSTLTWEDFAKYPDTKILKNKIASIHDVSPECVYLSFGSSECIQAVFCCFESNSTVITTEHRFPMYDVYAKLGNLQLRTDFNSGGDLIVLSRPSNPTGECMSLDAVGKVLQQHSHAWVLIDEAYIQFAENCSDVVSLLSKYPNLIVSRSMSKGFGAAGARVGYLLASSTIIDVIAKHRPMYEVAGPSMKYALFLLENQRLVEEYCNATKKARKNLLAALSTANIPCIASQGNWIHISDSDNVADALVNCNIVAKRGIVLYDKLWIRVTVGPGVDHLLISTLGLRNDSKVV